MLNYASQPDTDWGPAKNENRYGRYKPKGEALVAVKEPVIFSANEYRKLTEESEGAFRIRV